MLHNLQHQNPHNAPKNQVVRFLHVCRRSISPNLVHNRAQTVELAPFLLRSQRNGTKYKITLLKLITPLSTSLELRRIESRRVKQRRSSKRTNPGYTTKKEFVFLSCFHQLRSSVSFTIVSLSSLFLSVEGSYHSSSSPFSLLFSFFSLSGIFEHIENRRFLNYDSDFGTFS